MAMRRSDTLPALYPELQRYYQREMERFLHGADWSYPEFANCGMNIHGVVVMLVGMLASADEAAFGIDHGLGDAEKARRISIKRLRHGAYVLKVSRGGRYAATTVAEEHSADALARSFELLLPDLAATVGAA